jgi:hypothetical protein
VHASAVAAARFGASVSTFYQTAATVIAGAKYRVQAELAPILIHGQASANNTRPGSVVGNIVTSANASLTKTRPAASSMLAEIDATSVGVRTSYSSALAEVDLEATVDALRTAFTAASASAQVSTLSQAFRETFGALGALAEVDALAQAVSSAHLIDRECETYARLAADLPWIRPASQLTFARDQQVVEFSRPTGDGFNSESGTITYARSGQEKVFERPEHQITAERIHC